MNTPRVPVLDDPGPGRIGYRRQVETRVIDRSRGGRREDHGPVDDAGACPRFGPHSGPYCANLLNIDTS